MLYQPAAPSSGATPQLLGPFDQTLETTTGVGALVLPNHEMSVAGIEALRRAYPDRHILVLDNNPFNGVPKAAMREFLDGSRDWLRVIDHHGHFNDGVPRSTLPRLLSSLPELIESGFLCEGTLLVTNAMNLDPDGILSFFAAAQPSAAWQLRELLEKTADYTDFAVFGGERFTSDFTIQRFRDHPERILGLALLQTITDLKEDFVAATTHRPITALGRDEIRAVFIPSGETNTAPFDHTAVQKIYLEAINSKLERLHESFLIDPLRPTGHVMDVVERAIERLKTIYKNASAITEVYGVDANHPSGKVALMSPETGFFQRLDFEYPVYDWLQESAGQYVSDAPVHVRLYRGMLVVSLRYPRDGEVQRANYDVSPLIERLNGELIAGGCAPSLYGRREVVLGVINTERLPIQRVVDVILENWPTIARIN